MATSAKDASVSRIVTTNNAKHMIKSIKFKIWLTFLATLVVSVVAIVVLTRLSLSKSFLDYATKQAIDRLQFLETAVTDIYEQEKSLQTLYDNERQWRRLKYQAFREYIHQQKQNARNNNNPPPPPSNKAEQRMFIDQLILTTPDKSTIVGHPIKHVEYSWLELTSGDQIIGYIGYIRPKDFIRPVDSLFLKKQQKAFVWFGCVIFIATFGVALMVSRWLTRPLSELSKGAKLLAQGNYNIRINRASSDEMGQLCHNFNELAHTLSANEKARKQWVADISHEMRTPLSVLKAQLEAMEDGIRSTSKDNLALLKSKVESLNVLINDLYELSLSDLGALSYEKQWTPIDGMIKEIAGDYRARLANLSLSLQCQNTLNTKDQLFCDKNRIQQLLRNLLENSLRYTDSPGTIALSAERNKNTLYIFVEDSAPGVAAPELPKIFDRLYRIEASRNRETGGAGLGLSICKNIVEAHNGTISASPSPMGGLRISIELPIGE